MKLLDRLSNLLRSNLNSAIDSVSDPGKEIDLLIEEMDDEAKRARLALRDQIVQEKLGQKRVEEAFRNVTRWQEHAERAAVAGDDDLAREALRRLDDAEKTLDSLERALSEQSQAVQRLTRQLHDNDRKLSDIRSRKETLKARARTAKNSLGDGNAFSRFDQLVSQIEQNEHQAEAMADMAADPLLQTGDGQRERDLQTEEKFRRLGETGPDGAGGEQRLLGGETEMDARLRALKARVGRRD